MGFYVYVLHCADGSYYTGHTDNLEARLSSHQNGAIHGYTYSRRPIDLVYSEEFQSRQDAFDRERQIKGWSRAKKAALFEEDWDRLKRLARSGPSTSSG